MYRTISFLVAVILVVSSSLLRSDRAFANEAKFEVWYTNTNTGEPVREDYFSTMDQAVREANKVMQHRDTNTVKGIGDVWVTGSDGSRIWKNGQSLTPPDRADPKKPDLTPVRKLPSVDPGPMNWSTAKSKLKGKTGRGKIGDANVTIAFLANGEFTVSGDVEGKGKWSEDSSGTVRMETGLATFRGNINGDKVSGMRFWKSKDDGTTPTLWSLTLMADVLAGTAWNMDIGSYGGDMTFLNDGKTVQIRYQAWSGSKGYHYGTPLVGSYKLEAASVTVTLEQDRTTTFSGTLKNGEITGNYRFSNFDHSYDWNAKPK